MDANGLDRSSRIADYVGSLTQNSIIAITGFAYLVVYLPLALLLVGADFYLHTVDTLSVLLTAALAVAICAWVAFVRLPRYDAPEPLRRRENRGWWLIATGTLVVLVARSMYAVAELKIGRGTESIPLADAMFGLSFVFYVTGLMMIPWGNRRRKFYSFLLDAATVLVAVGALFWPLLFGPAVQGAFHEVLDDFSLFSYLFAAFILSFTILWIVLRDVREEMWPVALAFVLSIGAMVLTVLGYLAYLASATQGVNNPVPLFVVNAATTLSYLLIAAAGVLRINAVTISDDQNVDIRVSGGAPVHFWQIVLPYCVLSLLILVWIAMEFFDWRTEFTHGLTVGAGVVTVLILIRQVPLLLHNQNLYRRVAEAAIRDGLTGLYSHRALHDILRTRIEAARESSGSTAVIFLDIDFFKHYNDTFGHQQGDQLLVGIARILVNGVRSWDVVGRYGGEEFMIIAADIERADAEAMADRLRRTVEEQRFIQNGCRSSVTVSVGVALIPEDALDPEELIDLADQAMYRAKAAGRNQTITYSSVS